MDALKFKLVFDPALKEDIHENLLPKLEGLINSSVEFNAAKPEEYNANEPLLTYLSDEQLKTLIPAINNEELMLSILPHPDAQQACIGLGVDLKIEKAIGYLADFPDPVSMDVLYCNGRPLFNSLVIGQAFQLTTDKRSESLGLWKRVKNSFRRYLRQQAFLVDIAFKKDKVIKSAVSGIVVSQHKKSSLLARLMLDDSGLNDGMMHAFLVSPRSVMEMAGFAIKSIWHKNRLPTFGAHIKTDKLTLTFPEGEKEIVEDGNLIAAQSIELSISKKQLNIIPGSNLELNSKQQTGNEIFRTNTLPTGEAASEMAQGFLPVIRRATTDEFKDLFLVLRDNAQLKNSYLVLMVLSTVLATFGLFANSAPVVIGAMILAPLMAPIISLSMATLRQDRKMALNSFYTIIAGLGISLLFTIAITLITPIHTPGAEILARTKPNLLDLGIAVVSGIAGAYAHAREEVAKTLAGVAIAVALVPPLAVAGIGLGWADWYVFSGAVLLLFTNLAGMVLAASFTFVLLGFSPWKRATKGMLISFMIVLALSVPLALGFKQMILEHNITQQLDGIKVEHIIIKNVQVTGRKPLKISLQLASPDPIEEEDLNMIKKNVEQRLGQEAQLEVITVLIR